MAGGRGLQVIDCMNCGFESHLGRGYSSLVFGVGSVGATSCSLFQRSPVGCVCLCVCVCVCGGGVCVCVCV